MVFGGGGEYYGGRKKTGGRKNARESNGMRYVGWMDEREGASQARFPNNIIIVVINNLEKAKNSNAS